MPEARENLSTTESSSGAVEATGTRVNALRSWLPAASLVLSGVVVAVLPWSVRNSHADAAAQALRRAVELRPRSHVAHYNLARVYLALGDRKRAVEEAGIAANLYPSPDYQALLSQIRSGS